MNQLAEEDIYGHLLLHLLMVTYTAHVSVAAPTLTICMSIILYDVGHDYFCDNNTQYNKEYGETRDDSWDGKTCGPSSSCCEWNDPLYFCKHLHHTTFDDREIGLFSYDYFYRPATVSLIEIFVSRNSNKQIKNITSHIASYCLCQPTYTLHY